MIHSLRKTLANRVPALGVYWRKWKAFSARMSSPKATYSQHGEDQIILELLADFDLTDGIYVDVGANHPATISNSYLFYRRGWSGVVVEPNRELMDLHRWIRPRDIHVEVGCGARPQLAKFHLSKTPVLSSFKAQQYHGGEDWKEAYLPILTLDQIMAAVPEQPVLFLNIDVEGLDYQVLQGAEKTLERTWLICIEANEPEEEARITTFLTERGWQLTKQSVCNFFFINPASPDITKKSS